MAPSINHALLSEIMASQDEVGFFIRCHLYVEQHLYAACLRSAPRPDLLAGKGGRRQKTPELIRVLSILGFPIGLLAACGKLDDLRNKVAHGVAFDAAATAHSMVDALSDFGLDDLLKRAPIQTVKDWPHKLVKWVDATVYDRFSFLTTLICSLIEKTHGVIHVALPLNQEATRATTLQSRSFIIDTLEIEARHSKE